jgi:hypothetical protein
MAMLSRLKNNLKVSWRAFDLGFKTPRWLAVTLRACPSS